MNCKKMQWDGISAKCTHPRAEVADMILTHKARFEKLERDNERLWEVVKCLGKEEK